MTDEEINAAIAEACGWTDFSQHPDWGTMAIEPGTHRLRTMIPSYSSDLNWMHEAEKALHDPSMRRDYSSILGCLVKGYICLDAIYATARQRAEAFLRALGKWKD